MPLKWTTSVQRDLVRLHAFLAPVNPRVAAKVVQQLVTSAAQLLIYPQLGTQLEEFAPRDVRRMIVGDYELRYEVTQAAIYILRLWHTRLYSAALAHPGGSVTTTAEPTIASSSSKRAPTP